MSAEACVNGARSAERAQNDREDAATLRRAVYAAFVGHTSDVTKADAAARMIEDRLAAARQEAIRNAADIFAAEYGEVWGGDAAWLTTGHKVAAVVADRLRALATDHEMFNATTGETS